MVKLNESDTLGRKCGSRASLALPSVELIPGKIGCGRVADGIRFGEVWSGAIRPFSVAPIRNAFPGVTEAPAQVPLFMLLTHCTGWMGPMPSNGTRAWSTPFKRP